MLKILIRRNSDHGFENPAIMDRRDTQLSGFLFKIMLPARSKIDFLGIPKDFPGVFIRALSGSLFEVNPGDELLRQQRQFVTPLRMMLKKDLMNLFQLLLKRNGIVNWNNPVGKIMFQYAFQFIGTGTASVAKRSERMRKDRNQFLRRKLVMSSP